MSSWLHSPNERNSHLRGRELKLGHTTFRRKGSRKVLRCLITMPHLPPGADPILPLRRARLPHTTQFTARTSKLRRIQREHILTGLSPSGPPRSDRFLTGSPARTHSRSHPRARCIPYSAMTRGHGVSWGLRGNGNESHHKDREEEKRTFGRPSKAARGTITRTLCTHRPLHTAPRILRRSLQTGTATICYSIVCQEGPTLAIQRPAGHGQQDARRLA